MSTFNYIMVFICRYGPDSDEEVVDDPAYHYQPRSLLSFCIEETLSHFSDGKDLFSLNVPPMIGDLLLNHHLKSCKFKIYYHSQDYHRTKGAICGLCVFDRYGSRVVQLPQYSRVLKPFERYSCRLCKNPIKRCSIPCTKCQVYEIDK